MAVDARLAHLLCFLPGEGAVQALSTPWSDPEVFAAARQQERYGITLLPFDGGTRWGGKGANNRQHVGADVEGDHAAFRPNERCGVARHDAGATPRPAPARLAWAPRDRETPASSGHGCPGQGTPRKSGRA